MDIRKEIKLARYALSIGVLRRLDPYIALVTISKKQVKSYRTLFFTGFFMAITIMFMVSNESINEGFGILAILLLSPIVIYTGFVYKLQAVIIIKPFTHFYWEERKNG